MAHKGLLKKEIVEPYEVTSGEINSMVAVAKSDVKTARSLLNSDVCWAFTIAYTALLETAIALIHSKGFRPVGEAKHVAVILFLRKFLGKKYTVDLDRFDQMRRRRNKAVYGALRDITEYEAKDAVKFAGEFIEELIKHI